MKYAIAQFGREQFPNIADRKERERQAEVHLVHEFFGRSTDGFFVEVGANDPKHSSQTWHLEQQGWSGILVEPIPALCERLRAERPRSVVVEAACSAPNRVGTARFNITAEDSKSSLDDDHLSTGSQIEQVVEVNVTTLDALLDQHTDGRTVDFISIDVEGDQLAVLQGFDLRRHRPSLLLLEDHLIDYRSHFHVRRCGYRLVKRTGLNNWYIPEEDSLALTTWDERFALWRKLWLRTWARNLKVRMRGHRQDGGQALLRSCQPDVPHHSRIRTLPT